MKVFTLLIHYVNYYVPDDIQLQSGYQFSSVFKDIYFVICCLLRIGFIILISYKSNISNNLKIIQNCFKF